MKNKARRKITGMNIKKSNGYLFYHHLFYQLLKDFFKKDLISVFREDYPEHSLEYQESKKTALKILKDEE